MPQIICRGLQEKDVIGLSETLSQELASIMDTPREWFLFEYVERKCYVLGKKIEKDSMIDVWWFDRGQEIKNKTAVTIDKALREKGYEHIEIIFHECQKESYFENGKHY